MTQIATVEKLLPGGYAEISVPRKTACGHDCEECAGCGMTGAAIKARAKNDPNAQPGEKVVVESSTKKLLGGGAGVCAACGRVPAGVFPQRRAARGLAVRDRRGCGGAGIPAQRGL